MPASFLATDPTAGPRPRSPPDATAPPAALVSPGQGGRGCRHKSTRHERGSRRERCDRHDRPRAARSTARDTASAEARQVDSDPSDRPRQPPHDHAANLPAALHRRRSPLEIRPGRGFRHDAVRRFRPARPGAKPEGAAMASCRAISSTNDGSISPAVRGNWPRSRKNASSTAKPSRLS